MNALAELHARRKTRYTEISVITADNLARIALHKEQLKIGVSDRVAANLAIVIPAIERVNSFLYAEQSALLVKINRYNRELAL